MGIIDPTPSMISFQQGLLRGSISPKKLGNDRTVAVYFDKIENHTRYTYAKLNGRIVTAFVNCVLLGSLNGVPRFQIGYAVPAKFRNQGMAKEIVRSAIVELTKVHVRSGIHLFEIEAVVGADNVASQQVAKATLSNMPTNIIDHFSGHPALHYLLRIAS